MSKPVLFATGLGKEIERAENLVALFDGYPGDKAIMSTHDNKFYAEATSGKYDTLIIDIFPTEHVCKNVIMMWHAIQGGKYIGLDEKSTYYKAEYADNMDYIIAAGSGGIDMFNQCTNVPRERIFDLGMPRTDRYKRKKKGDGHTILADKRGYLFAPTYRAWRDTPMPCIDWDVIDEFLTDDEIMVLKAHPYGGIYLPRRYKHIVEVSEKEQSVNYLYDADVVITDYSSIMFDAYLLKKPVVLFEKNPGYTETRGMYLDYPWQYCSRYARTELGLIDRIKKAKGLRTAEKRCLEYVADACDGHSIERIVEFIKEVNGDV